MYRMDHLDGRDRVCRVNYEVVARLGAQLWDRDGRAVDGVQEEPPIIEGMDDAPKVPESQSGEM